jgi:hypothetical protein
MPMMALGPSGLGAAALLGDEIIGPALATSCEAAAPFGGPSPGRCSLTGPGDAAASFVPTTDVGVDPALATSPEAVALLDA